MPTEPLTDSERRRRYDQAMAVVVHAFGRLNRCLSGNEKILCMLLTKRAVDRALACLGTPEELRDNFLEVPPQQFAIEIANFDHAMDATLQRLRAQVIDHVKPVAESKIVVPGTSAKMLDFKNGAK